LDNNAVLMKLVRLRPWPTNGINESYNKQYWSEYYSSNRKIILLKKKDYNIKNKERIAEYHKKYYSSHKDEMNRKQRERYSNRKNNNKLM
jgi:hypothetical protein